MQVKLKVLQGSSAGKEVKIPGPECLIGRHEDCHLRPKTDAISRRHCMILIGDDHVVIRDLNSKNGTFVNDERVEGDRPLTTGDRLRVARLEFEVLIEQDAKAIKPAAAEITKTESIKRTVEIAPGGKPDDDVIGDWLSEGDDPASAKKLGEPETRQFRLDETNQLPSQEPLDDQTIAQTVAQTMAQAVTAESSDESQKGKKKGPGKLPPRPAAAAADTRTAASDMLRKFFNRR